MWNSLQNLLGGVGSLFSQPQQQQTSQPKYNLNNYPNQTPLYQSPALTVLQSNAAAQPQGNVLGSQTSNIPSFSNIGPTSTPKKTTGGGGSGSNNTTNQLQVQQPNFSTVDDSALNDLYGGARAALDAQQSSLEGQLPIALQQLQTSATEQKNPFDQKLTEGTQQLNQQTTDTQQADANAMQMARQAFNELSQFYNSRFGGGSSAGPAALELLTRATAQNFGNIAQTTQKGMQQINDAKQKLTDFVSTQKSLIDKQVADKTQEIQQWFRDQLNNINSSRAMLESDKAAKRYEALQQRTNFVNQLAAQQYQYNLEIQKFAQEQLAAAQSGAGNYAIPNYDTANQLLSSAQQGVVGLPRENVASAPVAQTGAYGSYAAPNSINKAPSFRIINGNIVDENGNIVASTGA